MADKGMNETNRDNTATNSSRFELLLTSILHWTCQRLASRWALVIIVSAFLAAIAAQWNGPQSIATADEIGYVTSGVNLVAAGQFINPWGEPELWFPPVYPVLIGVLSCGGRIDPFLIARVISVVASVLTLLCIHRVALTITEVAGAFKYQQDSSKNSEPRIDLRRVTATLATLLLAVNPTFQIFGNRGLSEALALCFVMIGFQIWLKKLDGTSAGSDADDAAQRRSGRHAAIYLGLVIGLATLTRPECVLVAPLWCGIDWIRNRQRETFVRGLWCAAALVCLLLPYSAFLHRHTGQWTISNKGPVNLAAGRAAFHQTPREIIDERTLEMTYYPADTSLLTELKRVVFNANKLRHVFCEIYYRPVVASLIVVLMLFGIARLTRTRQHRLVLGLAASLVYLLIVLRYDVVGPKNLHMALPVFSMLIAVAGVNLWQQRLWYLLIPTLGLLAAVSTEGATRYPRWARTDSQSLQPLRDAGLQLRALHVDRGVMYENGASVAYYSGMWRRYLTSNSLETVLNYIDRHESFDSPVYLAVAKATSEPLHPTVKALLNDPDPRLEQLLAITKPDKTVVYRVKAPAERPL